MNQYEIELRDKIALRFFDMLVEHNMIGEFGDVADPDILGDAIFEFANKVMCQRAKRDKELKE